MPSALSGRVARGYRRKRFYSTPNRILTHLSATVAHEPVTLSVLTQEGISASTHSGRTTATKWLARLEASGLVVGERAHVPGHRVRKTVYRLSHEGWFEVHDGTTRSAFLHDLAAFLARLGRRGLTNLLREGRAHAQPVTVRVLNHDLKDLPILLVLDNFQRANPDLARFLRGPILDQCRSNPTKVILISRTVPANLARRKAPKRTRIEVLRIGGLDMDASLSLLRAKGFAGDEVALQRVANTARGHPILLSFAAQTGSMVSGEMTRYLEREIWRTLTKDERTLLEAASLFRGLVPLDAMHCFTPEWQAAVHSLQTK